MRSALTKVPGVAEAEVALPDKAVVKIKKGSKVTPDQLIAAVKKAGYEAKEKKPAGKKEEPTEKRKES